MARRGRCEFRLFLCPPAAKAPCFCRGHVRTTFCRDAPFCELEFAFASLFHADMRTSAAMIAWSNLQKVCICHQKSRIFDDKRHELSQIQYLQGGPQPMPSMPVNGRPSHSLTGGVNSVLHAGMPLGPQPPQKSRRAAPIYSHACCLMAYFAVAKLD